MRIGFLGLGNMGMPMARNLLGLGHTVTVYNRTRSKARKLAALGAREASTIAEAVKHAEVAITVLSDDAAVAAVTHGSGGILRHLPPGSIHLCMTSLSVDVSAGLASAHAQANQGYVAAPMFGRVNSVASRHIWILAGGPEAQVNRCLPIFVALGRGLTRVGPNAALAHALKQAGNVLTVGMEKALTEIATSCEKAGMVPADYLRFLNTETFKFPLMDAFAAAIANPSFDPVDLSLDHAALSVTSRLEGIPKKSETSTEDEPELASADSTEGTPEPESIPEEEPSLQPELANTAMEVAVSRDETPVAKEAIPEPRPDPAPLSDENAIGAEADPFNTFLAKDGRNQVRLDLDRVTHFEVAKDRVWAWSQGKRYESPWRSLREVELAFNQVLFLPLRRRILLRPEAVLDLRPTFGGGSKARLGDNLELDVSRSATPRLKELIGI